jgi:hypothetical protein
MGRDIVRLDASAVRASVQVVSPARATDPEISPQQRFPTEPAIGFHLVASSACSAGGLAGRPDRGWPPGRPGYR